MIRYALLGLSLFAELLISPSPISKALWITISFLVALVYACLAYTPSTLGYEVISGIGMAPGAVFGPNVFGYQSLTTKQIFPPSYGLKVLGINARSDTAQVVKVQAIRNWANQDFVAYAMRQLVNSFTITGLPIPRIHPPVSVPVAFPYVPGPQPTAGIRLRRYFAK